METAFLIQKEEHDVVPSPNIASINSNTTGRDNMPTTTGSTASPRIDRHRHRFQNKFALCLTAVTMALLMTLSFFFGTTNNVNAMQSSSVRFLQQGEYGDDSNNNDDGDYSRYSCRYIYEIVPEPGDEQCRFAKTCNNREGVGAAFVFCSNSMKTSTLFLVISPFLLLWMVILFRLLGSTSEDYFSPSLEMFSVKLGLPPRFAGVTLLALGNGAADVSATMSAISNDEENGYKLALGALSGAAMVIGGVVAGIVVLASDGVPCRGALVRDATALLLTVIIVWSELGEGVVGPASVTLFLSTYGIFVCLVLVADVYHRAVVVPRLTRLADELEIERQLEDERQVHMEASGAVHGPEALAAMPVQPSLNRGMRTSGNPNRPSALAKVMSAMSNYENPITSNRTNNNDTGAGWGIDSNQLEQDQPIVLHGRRGILSGGDGTPLRPATSETTASTNPDGSGDYALINDDIIDRVCSEEGLTGISAGSWRGAFHDGKRDLISHFTQVWEDIAWNGDLETYEKVLLFCELPFTILRMITVAIPCDGYYNRGLIALSMVFSPLWFAYYLYVGHEINLVDSDSIPYFMILWLIALTVALFVLRFAPGNEGTMALGVATPLALYGFIIAATWIDYIADHLVALLDFLGIILHVPGAIMGLTVLAWGNSMGDLSANLTMARKGLANMAMTACFAGPVFNLLMGLGLGFSKLAAMSGNPETPVSLSLSVKSGFLFLILNSLCIITTGVVFGKGRIEKYYGYIALGLYTLYLAVSISIQFSKYGDEV